MTCRGRTREVLRERWSRGVWRRMEMREHVYMRTLLVCAVLRGFRASEGMKQRTDGCSTTQVAVA